MIAIRHFSCALLAILFLVHFAANGQDEIDGIGKFKLRKTLITSLDSIGKEYGYKKGKALTEWDCFHRQLEDQMNNSKGTCREVVPDDGTYRLNIHSHNCKDVRVFNISKLRVAGIKIGNMFLTFRRDTLVAIEPAWSRDLVEAFQAKYGQGTREIVENESDCKVLGIKETIIYERWWKGDITCVVAIGDNYDTKCEQRASSYIGLVLPIVMEEILNCDMDTKQNISDERKKQLKDF
jgi:hypothetical protein